MPIEPYSLTTDRALLLEIRERLERMERLHNTLLVKQPKQKDLARQMGIHPTTLSRRRRRERMRQMVGAA